MLRTMKTYNFVATLMMLSDVLPVLTCLSRALQAKTADFTLVASQLTYVHHSLQQIKERPNDQEYLSTVHDTVTDLAIGVVDLETARENFNKNVLQPYLEEVSRQISCRFKDTLGLLTVPSIHRNAQQMSSNCTNMALQNWRSSQNSMGKQLRLSMREMSS